MPLNSLKRRFEERKEMLTETLRKGRNDLDPAKQHQIYGAIKEIDKFLESIAYFRGQISEKMMNINLIEEQDLPEDNRGVLKKMADSAGSFFSRRAVAFNRTIIGGIGRFFKGIADTFNTYREVSKEVKRRKRKISEERRD